MAIIGPLNAYIPARQWYLRLAILERQVCRVEVVFGGTEQFATGFLVGPNLVLTSYHALKSLVDATFRENNQTKPSLRFRFDYIDTEGQVTTAGSIYESARSWLVDFSPVDIPSIAGLDYVLVQVDGSPGQQILENGTPRGWVEVLTNSSDIQIGGPLAILQHPVGMPLQISIDTHSIQDFDKETATIFYRTNTEPGSSGAPCFDLNWRLIAMHQGTDIRVRDRNRGILIDAMVKVWEARNILHLLMQPSPSILPMSNNYPNILAPNGAFALEPGLRELILRGESELLELKAGLRQAKKGENESQAGFNIAKAVCGFMNHKDGGIVVIGLSNEGNFIGVNDEYSLIDKSKPNWDGYELFLGKRKELITPRQPWERW